MATEEQLSHFNNAEEQLSLARSEGRTAAIQALYKCNYSSGSGLYTEFCEGFVARASQQDELPKETPMYLAGRVAFLKGKPINSKPEGELFSGRWVSGWLVEKDNSASINRR